MATRIVPKTPSLCLHKPSGNGFVRLNGKVIYLGRYGDAETERRYHELIAEWVAAGRQARVEPDAITVEELVARFWVHAQQYYVKPDGSPTSELDNVRQACRPLTKLYGTTKAADFGPLALKAVRQEMIERGWCRSHINKMIGRLKTVFRWAAENELIPGSVHHALIAVAGLKRGRCGVRDTDPVRCVPQQHVDAIQPFVSKQVWAMVQLQIFPAARAGELVMMRACDIDRSGDIWVYRPTEHKTAHHGHSRAIYIGPRGQQALTPFLLRPPESYCFAPVDAETERRRRVHAARTTPLNSGILTQRGVNVVVVAFWSISDMSSQVGRVVSRYIVKRPDMPMDVGAVSVALAEIGYARLVALYGLARHIPGKLCGGLGSCQSLPEADRVGIDYLAEQDITDREKAECWLHGCLSRQESEALHV